MPHSESPFSPIKWVAVYFPILIFLLIQYVTTFHREVYLNVFEGELGINENLQVLLLFLALVFAIKILQLDFCEKGTWFFWYIVSGLVVVIFVLGEEISWGQVYFNWNTPEWYADINKQQETNFHNSTSWLNFKPRAIMEALVMIIGIFYPITYGKRLARAAWEQWVLPVKLSMTAAIMTLVVKVISVWVNNLGMDFPGIGTIRRSEVQEIFIYYFIFLYVYSIFKRAKERS